MVLSSAISSFPRSTWVGFDRLFDDLVQGQHSGASDTGFPRHNIIRTSDTEFMIELAVAGVSEEDISITVKDGKLMINGQGREDQEGVEYVHRGITSKPFNRVFRLAEHTVVDGAEMINGVLTVYLRIEIPEEKKPRQIPIGKRPSLLTE